MNMDHLPFVGALAMFLIAGLSVPLDAAESTIRNAYVTSVFANDQANPKCAVTLDRDVAKSGSAVLACAAGDVLAEENTVFLHCGYAGDDAYTQNRMFDLALLAFRTNRPVDVRVTDHRREGCYATDIWLKRAPSAVEDERDGDGDHGRDDDDCEDGDDADDCGVDRERRDDD